MGYSNRYRMMNGMWSKSSRQYANRFGRNVAKLGLGLGVSLLSGGKRSYHSGGSRGKVVMPPVPSTTDGLSEKSTRTLGTVLICLALAFQALSFVSYTWWGFWTFFSLLVFSSLSTIALNAAFAVVEECKTMDGKMRRRFLLWIVAVSLLLLCLNLWPVFVKDNDRSSLSYDLLAVEEGVLLVTMVVSFYNSPHNPFVKKRHGEGENDGD